MFKTDSDLDRGKKEKPTVERSIRLFRAFLREQSNPDHFYSILAEDSARQLAAHTPLDGRTLLDVGGGPGYFAEAFRRQGAYYIGLDPDVGELSARGAPEPGMIRASGTQLPVRTGSVDICYSSNVLEHVSEPWTMLTEMTRVTRQDGIIFMSFTPWWSPWGGHETAPWHYLGGHRARLRYRRKTGKEPKNSFGTSLFPVTVAAAQRWARNCPDAELLTTFPRYHPWWAKWLAHVPVVREIVSWNLVLVLRKK